MRCQQAKRAYICKRALLSDSICRIIEYKNQNLSALKIDLWYYNYYILMHQAKGKIWE